MRPWDDAIPTSQFSGQFRWGRVSSVDKGRHSAQVQFQEIDGLVSWDLPVLTTRQGDYALPATDTPVLCLMVNGRLGVGYVLGCFYTDSDAAPLSDAGQRSIASDDLRLGAPDADAHVALSTKVKDELDKIKSELDAIHSGLSGHTHPYVNVSAPATTSPPAAPPYNVGYSPSEPAAEKVKAK